MSIELGYGTTDYEPNDRIPSGSLEEALAIGQIAWFLSLHSKVGSDQILYIPADQKDKELIAVMVDKGSKRLIYNDRLTGVFINKRASVVKVMFGDDNNQDYITLNYNPDHIFFVFLDKTV